MTTPPHSHNHGRRKGERLRPATLTCPKPLLQVAGKPIIDYNTTLLRANGITDITVTVNYLAEQIEQHFSHENLGVK
ncbi:sugar phosphate nucleotidyltransferase, partial [Paramuribaculum intestinale]|uniref:sugar phosphate nucleotidyltransferase n=1 Tax=Paramuribaculum intestinale TaxID=2094151 RepID=UPI0035247148